MAKGKQNNNWLFHDWGFLSVADIASAVEMPRRKVALLVEQDVIQPCEPDPGRGRSRLFSIWSALLFRVAFDLELLGVKPAMLKQFVGKIDAEKSRAWELPRFQLYRVGDTVVEQVWPGKRGGEPPGTMIEVDMKRLAPMVLEHIVSRHPGKIDSIHEACAFRT